MRERSGLRKEDRGLNRSGGFKIFMKIEQYV